MRWYWVVLLTCCTSAAGFGAGRFTAAPAPVPDQYELKNYGMNGIGVIKLNKRTGQTWVKNERGHWAPM